MKYLMVLLVLLSSTSFARIGDTDAQFRSRLGKVQVTSGWEGSVPSAKGIRYEVLGANKQVTQTVVVFFINGLSVCENYHLSSTNEIPIVLKANNATTYEEKEGADRARIYISKQNRIVGIKNGLEFQIMTQSYWDQMMAEKTVKNKF